ncbi:MAG TPA: hypothetical protein VNZ67_10140, partial [bacterium]|nr:hypothetical protein [bacterium]
MRDRPARAFYGLLVGLWALMWLGLVLAPVGALAYFVLRGSPFLAVPLCVLAAIAALVYLGGRLFYMYEMLMAADVSFFEAWAASGPQRSRAFTVAGLTVLFMLLGMLLLVVPGIVVFLGLSLGPAVLVLEKLEG